LGKGKQKMTKVKKIKLTKNKINSLANIKNIDDIYHITTIVSKNMLMEILLNIKKSLKSLKRNGLDIHIIKIIRQSKDPDTFIKKINEEQIRILTDTHENLRSKASEKRKEGKDTFIADIEMMSLPLKIKIFESTKNKKDFYKIKKLILSIENNLK
jgi:hypothetical protein